MKYFSILFTAIILLTGSFEANAISRNGARYLRNAKSTVSISRLKVIKAYESGPVTRAVTSHYDNLNRNLGRAISAFNRIPRSDLGDPEVSAFGDKLRALSAHLNILKARVSRKSGNDKAEKDLFWAFKKQFSGNKYREAVKRLHNIKESPNIDFLAFMLSGGGAKKRNKRNKKSWRENTPAAADNSMFMEWKATLNELKIACNGKYRNITNLRNWSHTFDTQFKTWCELVNDSDNIIKMGIKNSVNSATKFYISAIDDAVDKLLNKNGFISTRTTEWLLYPETLRNIIRVKIAQYSAVAGVKLDDAKVLARLNNILAKALVIRNNSAKKHKLKDAGYRHSPCRFECMVKSVML